MTEAEFVELFVVGLVLDPVSQAPVLVLRNESNDVNIPIWIGIAEATAIASAIKHVELGRPLTHDLMLTALEQLDAKVVKIIITELKESTYFAELIIMKGDKVFSLDCRPSDAIALALRSEAGIYANSGVIEDAKRALRKKLPAGEESDTDKDIKVNFQEIDEEKWQEILDSLDADDFKYKI